VSKQLRSAVQGSPAIRDTMNGFADHGLDEDAFGEKKAGFVKAFDAFRTFPPSSFMRTANPMRIQFYDKQS
jgi:hypothetical protein